MSRALICGSDTDSGAEYSQHPYHLYSVCKQARVSSSIDILMAQRMTAGICQGKVYVVNDQCNQVVLLWKLMLSICRALETVNLLTSFFLWGKISVIPYQRSHLLQSASLFLQQWQLQSLRQAALLMSWAARVVSAIVLVLAFNGLLFSAFWLLVSRVSILYFYGVYHCTCSISFLSCNWIPDGELGSCNKAVLV